ncbi:G5 domain-containing protein [Gemella haemolysans]|uniref:LPXTG cell wall anchor domain-containing protein n=3 Tax=Gemella haemolysans TaxID=1379 RepID=A0ABX6KNI5_9BACL|nr:G5 domain-containing protein [Gemella haemolysans]QIX88956.1 LPXTG cell wall anchor domain-containing protein [Gemella haemolysans]
MNKKKYISVFAGSILLFNGVFVSLNVPNLTTNSIVVAAEDEPPADEEIPDAEQLGYQKQLKKLLDEADGYINDNDHESFDPFFEEEAETLRNLVTSIKDEYKVQKNILINRYNKVLEFAGRSSEKVPLVGGEENKPTPPAVTEVEKEFTETRPIPFETVKQDDATLDKGVEKEKTAGVEGVKTITYKAKFKENKEVANTRTKVKEEVTKQPVNKVVLVGTKPVVTEVEKEFTETQPIPFETVKQDDATLDKGVEKEKTAGVEGVKTITYKAKFKENKEVANTRTKVKEEVTKQPVNKVVLVGTKPVVTEVEKEFTETQPIPFETVKQDDATLDKGVEKEKTAGVEGVKTITYKAKFKENKEVANTRTKVKEEVTKQPVNKVVLVGTKPLVTEVEKEFTETQPIPFETVKQDDATLDKGVEKEKTAGVEGVKTITYKAKFKENKEVANTRTKVKEEVTKQPVNKVVLVGTKPVVTEVEKEFTETQPIPFETVKQDDATLDKGVEKEKTAGVEGVKTITYKAKFKENKEVANTRTKVKEEVTKQPVNKVVLVGTKPVVTEVEKEFTETQPIPFETVKQDDATLDKGVEKEKTAGVEGVKTITYKAKFKDNKEVANTRTKVKEEVTKQPVNKVVLVGTKEKTIAPGGTVVTPTPTPDFKPVPREKFSVTPEEGVQNLVEEKPRLEISTEEIPFSVEKRYNNKLEKGVQREIASGENGTRKVFSKVEMIAGKEKRTVVSTEIEKEAKNQILEIGTLDPKTNTTRNEENSKVKDINKDQKTESIKGTSVKDINKDAKIESNKGKLPLTGISQINTFIAGVFTLIIAGVLTIFKRKKR